MRAALLLLLAACSDKSVDSSPVESPVDSEPQRCGTALQELPDGVLEIAYDDDQGDISVSDFGFEPDGHVRELPLNEGVGFELSGPARVYGFAIQYTLLPGADTGEVAPETEVPAGLYADFGYNGFDYWHFEPLWEGTRCMEDISEGEWVVYALEEPLVIDQPGLLWAGHFRDGMADPAVFLDGDGPTSCDNFDDCHSALNLPDLHSYQGTPYWPGLSFPLQYHYMIRLYVEYTDTITDEARVFADATEDLSLSNRMSWGDYDNDGDDDLLTAGLRLYENEGGSFLDVTVEAGLSGHSGSSGGVWGDYDNDGCLDLIGFAESYTASETLLHSNCDGTFTDVTEAAGLSDVQSYNLCNGDASRDRTPTPAAAWFDLDNDGYLDLAFANFICWDNYTYYDDTFFLNNGDGSFTEISGERGFSTYSLPGRGVAPIDADQDGDVDLFINNYVLIRNLFYENNGDGTVSEVSNANGTSGHRDRDSGYYGHTIGAAFGDLDNDGDFDLISANLAHPRFWNFSNKTQVLLNDGAGQFTDLAEDWEDPHANVSGLRYQETYSVPVLADFDSDGNLDLSISAVYDGRPTDFYWGRGDGRFELDAHYGYIPVDNGWGMAVADYDNDGDMDLAARGKLMRNQWPQGEFVQVRAIGNVDSNWGAYGATVRAFVGSQTFVRHVQGGSGQGNQDSATLHFGLGSQTEVDAFEVDFPGGGTVRYEGPFPAGTRYWLMEDGVTASGFEWPL
ncbi:MAG: CRTAC1 family protein [Alphaproteobacteria bacterium]|nr:CRTAC1 family protein [Alphaproteobacteria bacterium]